MYKTKDGVDFTCGGFAAGAPERKLIKVVICN
jgi:hypothetical protein